MRTNLNVVLAYLIMLLLITIVGIFQSWAFALSI